MNSLLLPLTVSVLLTVSLPACSPKSAALPPSLIEGIKPPLLPLNDGGYFMCEDAGLYIDQLLNDIINANQRFKVLRDTQ